MTVQITPHLAFNGNCREAFAFYAEVLRGEITFMMSHADSPMKDQVPDSWGDAILHATLTIGKDHIMGADAPGDMYKKPVGVNINLNYTDIEDARRVYNALVEGGLPYMPFGETFWSKGFGMCTDRYGHHWMISTGELM
ncbi:hypothetical protein ABAC460_23515 [Asticcacaulis sp. AC460]|uniref:VOC family protein n=1 Tax=Asticcacaulis sp. AC460 TaxID=1282360 RepID=UPI0003C40F8C|nr:VOC family protein [Asticcacaulis sp. AC460]ESQ85568.1 hypothetical protein ABAC460_23515 [Asticcacaulis sp. AC460]